MALDLPIAQAPRSQTPIVGIDLGTTNSLVAFVKDGEPIILKSREGKNLVPSVVSFSGEYPVIGFAAKKNKVKDVSHTVFSVKRLLGRGFEDLKSIASELPYRLVPGEGPARIAIGDRTYSAVEISAMILRELKLGAESALGVPVTRAVITVPAYFNDSQRQATRAAGKLAGLDVLRIINEPTAASLAYGLDRKKQGLIAVYDLGGGTFDLSILKLEDGVFEVLATHGNTRLGGDDLDQAIAHMAESEIQKQFGISVRGNDSLLASVLEASEALKITLATADQGEMKIALPNGKTYARAIKLSEFESLVRPILEKTKDSCVQALKDAGIQASELSDLVMVGGPTRLKIVQKVAEEIFGLKPNTSVHPDEVVATGAAIQADILAGNNKDFLLLDVVPLSLGLETYGGIMSVLIPRNSRIPTVVKESFTTFVDNQTGVDIHVLQGERDRVEDNRSLSRFKLNKIQPQPAGIPRIQVSFLIDADGILNVSAHDLKTGNIQSIEVKPTFGLTDAEVEKMLMSGAEHAEADVKYRKLVEVKNEAEIILRAAERKLADAPKLVGEAEAVKIQAKVTELRVSLAGSDPEVIRNAGNAVNEVTKRLAELLMKEALASAVKRP